MTKIVNLFFDYPRCVLPLPIVNREQVRALMKMAHIQPRRLVAYGLDE